MNYCASSEASGQAVAIPRRLLLLLALAAKEEARKKMLRVFQNFEWEVPISGDRDGGGGAGRGKNDEIEDLGAAWRGGGSSGVASFMAFHLLQL